MLSLASVYQMWGELVHFTNNETANGSRLPFFSVVLIFCIAVIWGIYKNRRWSLYVFLSMTLFMTGCFLLFRLEIQGYLGVIDYWIVANFVMLDSIVIKVLLRLNSKNIFDKGH